MTAHQRADEAAAVRLLREDVHIHATPQAVFARLRAPEVGGWFGEAFGGPQLVVTDEEVPSLLVMAAEADGGELASLSWALHAEATGEVHLTMEAAYRPAGGLRALLQPLLYVPRRKQACRDALWRLKQLVEGGEAAEA
ncbi:MAG TPA: hypothetical protein QGI71_11540 [Dehalococcoidia bacterium]|nr:hypothetical protein [Dehalococcoidia bacterium]